MLISLRQFVVGCAACAAAGALVGWYLGASGAGVTLVGRSSQKAAATPEGAGQKPDLPGAPAAGVSLDALLEAARGGTPFQLPPAAAAQVAMLPSDRLLEIAAALSELPASSSRAEWRLFEEVALRIARADPVALFAAVEAGSIKRANFRSWAVGMAASELVSQDPAALQSQIETLADPELKRSAVNAAARSIVASNPRLALDLTESLVGTHYQVLMDSDTYAQWASTDPDAALAALDARAPEGFARTAAVRGIARGLAGRDFGEATRWTCSLRTAFEQETALEEAMRIATVTDPKGVLAHVEAMPDGEVRHRAHERLFASWIRSDAESAARWFDGAPAHVRCRVLERVAGFFDFIIDPGILTREIGNNATL